MATARRRDAWDRTAAVMALIAEVNRDRKRRPRPYTPADFHPLPGPRPARRRRADLTAGIEVLKVFLPKEK